MELFFSQAVFNCLACHIADSCDYLRLHISDSHTVVFVPSHAFLLWLFSQHKLLKVRLSPGTTCSPPHLALLFNMVKRVPNCQKQAKCRVLKNQLISLILTYFPKMEELKIDLILFHIKSVILIISFLRLSFISQLTIRFLSDYNLPTTFAFSCSP